MITLRQMNTSSNFTRIKNWINVYNIILYAWMQHVMRSLNQLRCEAPPRVIYTIWVCCNLKFFFYFHCLIMFFCFSSLYHFTNCYEKFCYESGSYIFLYIYILIHESIWIVYIAFNVPLFNLVYFINKNLLNKK